MKSLLEKIDEILSSTDNCQTLFNINRDSKLINYIESKPHPYLQLIEVNLGIKKIVDTLRSMLHQQKKQRVIFEQKQMIVSQFKQELAAFESTEKTRSNPTSEFVVRGVSFYSLEEIKLHIKLLELELEEANPENESFNRLLEECIQEYNVYKNFQEKILRENVQFVGKAYAELEDENGKLALVNTFKQEIDGYLFSAASGLPLSVTRILTKDLSPENAAILSGYIQQKALTATVEESTLSLIGENHA